MFQPIRRSIALLLTAMVAVACGGADVSPSASPAPNAGYFMRLTESQALPPVERFGWLPRVAITADGILISQGAVPAIYPGPLVTPLMGRQLTQVGFARIVERARALGLLSDNAATLPVDVAPGERLGRIELVVDGRTFTHVGDPSRVIVCIQAPCDPAPGTPEAFGTFWSEASDPSVWLGAELGPEGPYVPDGVALLVGPPVRGDDGIEARFAGWPLGSSLADLGTPIGGEAIPRCATLHGEDAAAFLAAASRADQLTNWVPTDGDVGDALFVQVRPLVPGEDVCAELFGVGG